MKLLITGGAGFIGSNFIRYWLKRQKDDQIVNLDKLTYAGHLSSIKDFSDNKNHTFIKGDITDPEIVKEAIKDVDVVVHFAAESHVDRSVVGPKVFVTTNVVGTQVLLDAAVKTKVKQFHHISTDEVFGSLELGSKKKFNEETLYDPRSPYSASKAASDHLVRAYHHTYGLPITITNCSNNYGPYQSPEKFIPRMITNLIDDQKIPIYGDGKYVRDWLYVGDHIKAIEMILDKGGVGKTYLVGGLKDDHSNLDIAKMLIDIFGKDESYIKFIKDRPGHDRRYAVDWGKINKGLGWKPKYSLNRWLKETVDWYRKNEKWWRPLKKEAEAFYKKTRQV